MNSYVVGNPVHCTVQFKNTGGTATDPTTITAKIRTPAGTITTQTYGDGVLLRSAAGAYYVDVTPTTSGTWSYRFIGAGALVATNEGEFFVQYSDFGPNG